MPKSLATKRFGSWSVLLFFYFLICAAYALFSYCLVHPNLVLTTWNPYWQFQLLIWKTLFNNRQLLVEVYVTLLASFFAVYGMLLWQLRKTRGLSERSASNKSLGEQLILSSQPATWKIFGVFLLMISPLLLSYNALSSDVFNYIFDAKMVLIYHVNPNFVQAQQFSDDIWLRFMSNTYGLAPYGYGWIGISLLPYSLGLNKFTLTWILFRLFSLLSVGLLFFSMQRLSRMLRNRPLRLYEFAMVFLNPLFLIEILSDAHNDLWMMWPAILAVSFLVGGKGERKAGEKEKKNLLQRVLIAAALFAFSISIKFATVVLIPVLIGLLVLPYFQRPFFKKQKKIRFITFFTEIFEKHWPMLAATLLFLPLMTERSRQFYPWYLTWVLVWLPYIKWRSIKMAVLVLSMSAMLRYTPWLLTNSFDYPIEMYQKIITWVPAGVWVGATMIFFGSRMARKVQRGK